MDKQESISASPEPAAAAAPDNKGVIPTDERTGTLIFAAVLTLFGLFWVWASSDLPNRQQTAYLSQGFVPITAGFLLAGLSAMLVVSTWLTKALPPGQLGREPIFEKVAELRHYLINTFILMLVGLAVAREPLRPRLFVLAAVMSLLFYGIFVWGIQLPLPGSKYG